ncbi:MAG: hypothetical protein NC417_04625 [Candidatus Gastranaerophilales bacterium]|nr:hypothetical protein [Candidatus Gastranaerophilales bacterium]
MWRTVGILAYLSILSVMDIKEKKVNVLFLITGVFAICVIWLWGMCLTDADWKEILLSGALGLIPGIFLLAIARLTGKAGYADGMVVAVLGMEQGYLGGVVLLCISLLYLSVCSIALLLCRRVKGNTRMPYLPFLTAAYLSILWLEQRSV